MVSVLKREVPSTGFFGEFAWELPPEEPEGEQNKTPKKPPTKPKVSHNT